MTRTYRGYEIRTYETMGIGRGTYYEIWKNDMMWGFTASEVDAEIMIDQMIERGRAR